MNIRESYCVQRCYQGEIRKPCTVLQCKHNIRTVFHIVRHNVTHCGQGETYNVFTLWCDHKEDLEQLHSLNILFTTVNTLCAYWFSIFRDTLWKTVFNDRITVLTHRNVNVGWFEHLHSVEVLTHCVHSVFTFETRCNTLWKMQESRYMYTLQCNHSDHLEHFLNLIMWTHNIHSVFIFVRHTVIYCGHMKCYRGKIFKHCHCMTINFVISFWFWTL